MIELALISDDATVVSRVKEICEEFSYAIEYYEGLDKFIEQPRKYLFVLAAMKNMDTKEAASEMAQAVRYTCKEAFLVCTVGRSLPKEDASFARKSGANLILLQDELMLTGKVEFILAQVLKANYFPIKSIDLAPNRPVGFDIFHLMPQRNKFLKFIFEGDVLNEAKSAKITEVGELYIQRSDIAKFQEYSKQAFDRSAAGLGRRCRSQFLSLYSGFSDLVFLLTDQSEVASYAEGDRLFKRCKALCAELLTTLAEFGNAWEIINNSTIGSFGTVERAPAIAAYVAIFSLQLELPNINEIMLCALLCDLGLVFMAPSILRKLRRDELDSLTDEEREAYHKFPLLGRDVVLDRKLPIEEKLRNILLSVHERADGKGFPRGLAETRIPLESQLINFCRDFDHRLLLRMGKARVDPERLRKQMIEQQDAASGLYTGAFIERLQRAFGA